MKDICKECKEGETGSEDGLEQILCRAIKSDHTSCVKLALNTLKTSGADVNTDVLIGPLLCAAEGKEDQIFRLLKAGADVNKADIIGRTALMVASLGGHLRCVNLLINKEADVNKVLTDTGPVLHLQGSTALMLAAKRGNSECVNRLVNSGADVNARDKDGDTALKYSADGGYFECVNILVKAGADVNIVDNYNDTALIMAAEHGREKCVEILLLCGADVTIANSDGYTALDHAREKGHEKCLKLLRKYAKRRPKSKKAASGEKQNGQKSAQKVPDGNGNIQHPQDIKPKGGGCVII